MALKFQCKNCGKDIAVRFLTVGETAECKSCGASNPVPESAADISDEAAKSIAEASVSEFAESISDEATENEPIAKALRIIGTLSIGFGVIAGIAMLILFGQSVASSSSSPTAKLSLGGVVTALGMMFYFCTLGVLCLGIAKVLELLSK